MDDSTSLSTIYLTGQSKNNSTNQQAGQIQIQAGKIVTQRTDTFVFLSNY